MPDEWQINILITKNWDEHLWPLAVPRAIQILQQIPTYPTATKSTFESFSYTLWEMSQTQFRILASDQ